MSRLFTFIQTYRSGILFLLLFLGCIAFLVQWFAWIFGWGRFRPPGPPPSTGPGTGSGTGTGTGTGTGSGYGYAYGSTKADLRYIFSEAAVKIINDFRHLLALIVVLIFAFALGYSMIKAASVLTNANTPTMVENMKNALQAVVATLGGLVGSIIGYYFGESSVVKAAEPGQQAVATPPPDTKQITPAPVPPKKPESPTPTAEKGQPAPPSTEKVEPVPPPTQEVEPVPPPTEEIEPVPPLTEKPD